MLPGRSSVLERTVWARKDVTKLYWDPNTDHFDLEKSAFIPTNMQKGKNVLQLKQEKLGAGCGVGGCLSILLRAGEVKLWWEEAGRGWTQGLIFAPWPTQLLGYSALFRSDEEMLEKSKSKRTVRVLTSAHRNKNLHCGLHIPQCKYIYWFLPHCCKSIRKESLLAG